MQEQEKEKEPSQKNIHADGYKNLLNKYGTKNDASEQYRFERDEPVTDIELSLNYEENGLFTRIIDIPADDAVSSGFSYGITCTEIETFINKSLEELDFEEVASTALKWARLYGGSIVVMMIDDGKELIEPVDWDNIQGIDELLVFERPLVTPDYTSVYKKRISKKGRSKFGMPEFYDISPMYGGTFRVHESRCLLFRNGKLPSISTRAEYRFFGMPEYARIHKSLQETVTSHGNGVRLLDRANQAIYKLKSLAELLAVEDGEDKVLQRMRIIDMARGFLNSIVIDADGEDYDFKNVSFSGVKDILDATCNMLSAVTQIPQTKLFGRSPAGENATGEGDMENYYKFVEKIQKLNLKNNLGTILDIILLVGKAKGEFEEIPKYQLEFKPLWSLSENEQAGVEQIKATTEFTKAQTTQIYVDMQAIDASEVRSRLAKSGEFTINDILQEEVEEDWNSIESSKESEETSDTALSTKISQTEGEIQGDSMTPMGCGVIVVKDGKILVGTRKDNGLICGPGGHIEQGETPEEAAIRETREEFGINVAELIPITILSNMPIEYCPSQVFLCTEYYGELVAVNTEMKDARFESVADILKKELFLPFQLSMKELLKQLQNVQKSRRNEDEKWITTKQGKHIQISENGELLKGHSASIGGGDKIQNPQSTQKKSSEKPKNELNKPVENVNIKSEIEKRGYSIKLNPEKQGRHIKEASEYIQGRSYLTITVQEAQDIVNKKCGTGIPVVSRTGEWQSKEKIVCDSMIGVDIDKNTKYETSTNLGTIHYGKTGSHLVPRKET